MKMHLKKKKREKSDSVWTFITPMCHTEQSLERLFKWGIILINLKVFFLQIKWNYLFDGGFIIELIERVFLVKLSMCPHVLKSSKNIEKESSKSWKSIKFIKLIS